MPGEESPPPPPKSEEPAARDWSELDPLAPTKAAVGWEGAEAEQGGSGHEPKSYDVSAYLREFSEATQLGDGESAKDAASRAVVAVTAETRGFSPARLSEYLGKLNGHFNNPEEFTKFDRGVRKLRGEDVSDPTDPSEADDWERYRAMYENAMEGEYVQAIGAFRQAVTEEASRAAVKRARAAMLEVARVRGQNPEENPEMYGRDFVETFGEDLIPNPELSRATVIEIGGKALRFAIKDSEAERKEQEAEDRYAEDLGKLREAMRQARKNPKTTDEELQQHSKKIMEEIEHAADELELEDKEREEWIEEELKEQNDLMEEADMLDTLAELREAIRERGAANDLHGVEELRAKMSMLIHDTALRLDKDTDWSKAHRQNQLRLASEEGQAAKKEKRQGRWTKVRDHVVGPRRIRNH